MDLYYGPYYVSVIGNTVLSANTWHHVAGVYNGSQLQVYVDGVLDNSLSTSVTITSTSMSLLIGESRYPYNHSYFNGLIDEVRISNAAVYTANFTPSMHLTASSSTKGLWKFDGQTANDSSGNGNNGTLNGGATYSIDVPSGDGGGSGGGGTSPQIHWLVTDQLGTPRMVFDQTGSLANVSRHDYLPFGEELFGGPPNLPGTGGRLTTQGYGASDNVRQKFTGYERDNETSLDYAQARYYASAQGRFTSVDPLGASASPGNPQTFNRYSYVTNSPYRLIDPSGMFGICPGGGQGGQGGMPINSFSLEQDDPRQPQPRPARRNGDPIPSSPNGSESGVIARVPVPIGSAPTAPIATSETPLATTVNLKPVEPTPPPGPDYTSLEVGTGGVGPGLSFSVTRDRSGNWYVGIKPNVGVTLFPVTASVVHGEVYNENSQRATNPTSVRSAIEGLSVTGQLTFPTTDTIGGSLSVRQLQLAPLFMQGSLVPTGVRTKEYGHSINIPGSASAGFQRVFHIPFTGP